MKQYWIFVVFIVLVIFTSISISNAQTTDNATVHLNILDSTCPRTLNLEVGWNLVSFPCNNTNMTSVSNFFSSIDGKYSTVVTYNSSKFGNEWEIYGVSIPSWANTLDEISVKQGYWINVTTATTFVNEGSKQISTNITLQPVWNLVGYPTRNQTFILDVMGATNYTLVEMYNATDTGDEWKVFDPNVPLAASTFTNYTVDFGYWIHANVTGTWNITW